MARKISAQTPESVRIIGGKWRSRQLKFSATEGLRPTGSRIRETLFNWLAPYIEGARCLDLFSGSGALCFEALSRGAKNCTALENNSSAIDQLSHFLAKAVGHLLIRGFGILDRVVQQRGDDGGIVQPLFREDSGDGDGMREVWLA